MLVFLSLVGEGAQTPLVLKSPELIFGEFFLSEKWTNWRSLEDAVLCVSSGLCDFGSWQWDHVARTGPGQGEPLCLHFPRRCVRSVELKYSLMPPSPNENRLVATGRVLQVSGCSFRLTEPLSAAVTELVTRREGEVWFCSLCFHSLPFSRGSKL